MKKKFINDGQTVYSPVLLVRADTSIKRCIELMKEKNIGSALITHDKTKDHQEVIGIFTERDLLRKVNLVFDHQAMDKPIRTVMTSPVRSIDIQDIDQAGELMLRHDFRHVPVMKTVEGGRSELLGVLSMRDLFESLLDDQEFSIKMILKQAYDAAKKKARLVVIESESQTSVLLKEGFGFLKGLKTEKMTYQELLSGVKGIARLAKYDIILLDTDSVPEQDWSNVIQQISKDSKLPLTLILHTPDLHNSLQNRILNIVGHSRRFFIFEKPVSITTLLYQFSPFLFLRNQ